MASVTHTIDGLDCDDNADHDLRVYIDVRHQHILKDAFRECKKKKFDLRKLLRVL